MSKGSWRGIPLESYSKDELIEIVLAMGRLHDGLRDQAARDRDMMLGRVDRGRPNWTAFLLIYGGIALLLAAIGLGLRLWIHGS